ncbi:MAG: hypothetical protein H6Q99_3334 [Proteobacteria bacterium]|nr:hypothetical protein [Pseudomonadota bacterium]
MAMTCVDQTMVRRDRRITVFLPVSAVFARAFATFSWRRDESIEDFNDHKLRDIGFADGRATEAGMRRAAERRGGFDRF